MTALSRALRYTAVAAAVCVLAACSSKADRIASSLHKGADYVHASDWDKAGVEVRNVLQMDPKNARAYLIGAQVAEGQRDVQRAYGSYLKAVELDPALIEAKVGLARIYLLAGEAPKAQGQIDEVLKADAGNVGARTLQAALTARGGNIKAATDQAQAIVTSATAVPAETSMLLAGLYANQGDVANAARVVDAALKAEPKNIALLQVAAQVAADPKAASDLAKRAPEFYRRATEQTPKDDTLWNVWAAYHMRRGELDAAESVLRDAARAQPESSKRQLALFELVARRRGHDAAEKEFRTAIDKRPKDTELRFGLVELHRAAGRESEALRELKAIIDLAPQAPAALQARDQIAAYRFAGAQYAEARALVDEVLAVSARDNAALLLRGRLALREGKPRDAIIDLRAAVRDQPGSPEVVGLLAQAHLAAGEPQLAREVLADAVKFKPEDVDLRLLLAAQMSDAKDYKLALSELDDALRVAPAQTRLYEAKAQIQLTQKDVVGAEKTLVALKEQLPGQAIGYLRLGQFQAEQKRFDAALKTYDAGAAAVPGDPTLVLSAIGVLTAQKKFSEIDARIDALAKAEPQNPLPHQVRGDLAMLRQDHVAAEAAYRKMIQVAPKLSTGYQGVARALALRKDVDGAVAVLEQGVQANPEDLGLQKYRAEFLARASRQDEAIKAYEALVAKSPGDEAASNNLAYLLVEAKGDATSLQHALQLTSRFAESRNPSYLDSLAWVHYKLGDYAKAVPLLDRAVALQPASPLYSTHLGMALVRSGDRQRGQELLKKVLSAKADVPYRDEVRTLAGVN